jgi:hypothetical protein
VIKETIIHLLKFNIIIVIINLNRGVIMKYNKFMNQLNQIFENPEKVDMSQLEKLLFETLKFFDSIRERLSSKDPKEREKAMEEAAQMQEKLNEVTDKIYAKTGLTKEKAQQILSNPANFKPEDWETMKHLEQELHQFHKKL